MIRTTLAVSTSRLRVLAAKATVVCAATFVAGLIAALAAFQLAQPALRSSGFEPPAYPHASLSQGPVFRAVFGTAIFLALLALLSLAVGVVMRRAAPAIASLIGLLVVPQIVAAAVPSLEVSNWILRLMPSAGLAIQQTRDRPDTAIGPWPGLAVTLGYVVVALGFAALALRRRDA
jgi:ABC-type transport system involved in multi-copper enzyme maturation permease subunit